MPIPISPLPWALDDTYDPASDNEIIAADGFEALETMAILPNYEEKTGAKHWKEHPDQTYIERSEETVLESKRLIVSAVNAMGVLNPLDPMAAANGIVGLVETLEIKLQKMESINWMDVEDLRNALAIVKKAQ